MTARRMTSVLGAVLVVPLVATPMTKAADQAETAKRIELAQLVSPEEAAKRKREAEERAKQRGSQGQNQRPPGNSPEGRRGPPQTQSQPNVQQTNPQPKVQPRIVTPPPPVSPKTTTTAPIIPRVPVPPKPPTSVQTLPPADKKVLPPSVPGRTQAAPSGNSVPFIPPSQRRGNAVLPPKTQEGVNVAPPPVVNSGTPVPFKRSSTITPPPQFNVLQQGRQTRTEGGGRRTVIQEPGNRTIIRQDNRVIIRHDEAERFKRFQNARTMRMPNGVSQTFFVRPDGVRVVTETDRNGHLLRRFRRGPDGREVILIDNRRFWRNAAIGVGVVGVGALIALSLRPPVVSIPRERYIVEYDRASDDDLYETLIAPPVERLERVYSLEEVRHSAELRERVRRVDLDAINFEFGAFEVGPDQFSKLERLAKAMDRVIRANPEAIFMIEGHTDAVGNDVDNLSLSDRRAQSVAQILSENFGIPPENLVTQGYGEQYLKVNTREAERQNRRVTVRNVTSLMSEGRQ